MTCSIRHLRFISRLLLLGLGITACSDETATAYGAAGHKWKLQELNGNPAALSATLIFPKTGVLSGTTPCLRYSGRQPAPYPWFDAASVKIEEVACPPTEAEDNYLTVLATMAEIEVLGGVLILRNSSGSEMLFKSNG